jgi:hypothetical protein
MVPLYTPAMRILLALSFASLAHTGLHRRQGGTRPDPRTHAPDHPGTWRRERGVGLDARSLS